MRIGIAGPIATSDVAHLLDDDASDLPRGYFGAPVVGTLVDGFLRRGHEVVAFTTSDDLESDDSPVTATGNRFKVIFVPVRKRAFRWENGRIGRAADGFRYERRALLSAMRSEALDVLHAHWTYEFALAALDSGLPTLITCHDAPHVVLRHSKDFYRLVRYFMAKRVFSRAQCLTAVSPYLVRAIAPYARVPIAVVPNPVAAVKQLDEIAESAFDVMRPKLGMVLNGWIPLKNPQPAIKAFALLRERVPLAELVLIGREFGPEGAAQTWAARRGLAQGIHFVGELPHRELLAVLRNLDLLVHPSLEETFGMAAAEAMALGVPVIGGERSGAVPWLIGDGGLVCDVRDPQAILESMLKVLVDQETRARYGENAVRRVRHQFATEKVCAMFENLYIRVRSGDRVADGGDTREPSDIPSD